MTVPKDVLRFEVLLYLSLLIDALSAAFLGVGLRRGKRREHARVDQSVRRGVLRIARLFLVWLAARRRKNWARWSLLAFFVLSVVSLVAIHRRDRRSVAQDLLRSPVVRPSAGGLLLRVHAEARPGGSRS